jgi:phage portal protein BeeE
VNLLQSLTRGRAASSTQRFDGADFAGVDPLDFAWTFNGNTYAGVPGWTGNRTEGLESSFPGMAQGAYKRNGVVFACMRTRLSVFSEARFQFRRMRNGRPGDLFGDQSLALLEQPWPNGTTGDLLTRMLQDADLAGNSYWTVRNGNLRRMRPDWVSIVMGSRNDPQVGPDDLDAELVGYAYWPGGFGNKQKEPVYLLPDEVSHFAPVPDPLAHYRGISWLTPIIREVESDSAATVHKLAFFQNGATLQTIVSFKDMKQEVFEKFVKQMDLAHKGAQNAYKTLYLGGGADATVVGADLRQLDFKATQGAGETRIAAAAGVPAAIVGLSEGLQGSSLNAGNLNQLKRLFAETTMSTLWRNAAGSLATLVPPPKNPRTGVVDAELAIDARDIPFLQDDRKDRADIQREQSATIVALINGGYEPDSVTAAVAAEDWSLLVHTGLVSVQLQPPGVTFGSAGALSPAPPKSINGAPAPALTATGG